MGSIKNSRLLFCSWMVSNQCQTLLPSMLLIAGEDRNLALASCSLSASRSPMLLVMSVWDFHHCELCPSRKSVILYTSFMQEQAVGDKSCICSQ